MLNWELVIRALFLVNFTVTLILRSTTTNDQTHTLTHKHVFILYSLLHRQWPSKRKTSLRHTRIIVWSYEIYGQCIIHIIILLSCMCHLNFFLVYLMQCVILSDIQFLLCNVFFHVIDIMELFTDEWTMLYI